MHRLVVVSILLCVGRLMAEVPPGQLPPAATPQGVAAPQVAGTISGRIVDRFGAVLSGVTVDLLNSDGIKERTEISDGNGRFVFSAVAVREYRVRATLQGFAVATQSVRATIGGAQDLRIQLAVSDGGTINPPPPLNLPPSDGKAVIPVFFATDRQEGPAAPITFSGERRPGGNLTLGRFDVSIPRDHRMGQLERPTIWTLYKEYQAQHFVIVGRKKLSYGDFYQELGTFVQRSSARELFVFVHGYKVGFEDAIYRTAQIAYDLGFEGAPVAYSWPSEGAFLKYPTDLNNSEWTAEHLRWFLEDLSAKSGATKIHLIAHSMGNRALTNALSAAVLNPSARRPQFSQVALTAPDVDRDVFRQLAPSVASSAQRVTLYASSNDIALRGSMKLQGYPRAGDAASGVLVVPNVDSIDASDMETDMFGHSYVADNRSVLSDIFEVLKGKLPIERFGLQALGAPATIWWKFKR